jgi:hypothetical protein
MQVKEMAQEGGQYVSFGPAATTRPSGASWVAPAPDPGRRQRLRHSLEAEIANYRRQIEAAGQAPLQFESGATTRWPGTRRASHFTGGAAVVSATPGHVTPGACPDMQHALSVGAAAGRPLARQHVRARLAGPSG